MIDFAQQEDSKQTAQIKVIGVGGGGGNTVNSIIEANCKGIECIVANSDAQALGQSRAPNKIQIGIKSTKGLGTGANPELGKRAAEEDLDKIVEAIGDADIVFLTAGMGGGTGSGALPVVAKVLKDLGILSIALVTKPFQFEGKRRAQVAEHAIAELKKYVDTLIVIPNEKLLNLVDDKISTIQALDMINNVLRQSVQGISDIITKPGLINVDFADVHAIMKDMGLAVLGTARASGEHRAQKAAEQAISSPLFENVSIDGARSVLLNITGGTDLGLHEISQAASIIYERADENANIILGSVIDPAMEDEVAITIIATGFKEQETIVQEEKVIAKPKSVIPAAEKQPERAIDTINNAQHLTKTVDTQTDKKIVKEEIVHKKERQSTSLVDLNDLDVPTFLRKE